MVKTSLRDHFRRPTLPTRGARPSPAVGLAPGVSDIQGEGLEAIVMSNPMIGKALSIEEQFKANAQERRLYDMREKAIFSDATNLAAAEAKGKVMMAQDIVCQYLEARFGSESQTLQGRYVRSLT